MHRGQARGHIHARRRTASLKAKLEVGSYRALVTPIDAAGNRGASRTLTFKVTRG